MNQGTNLHVYTWSRTVRLGGFAPDAQHLSSYSIVPFPDPTPKIKTRDLILGSGNETTPCRTVTAFTEEAGHGHVIRSLIEIPDS